MSLQKMKDDKEVQRTIKKPTSTSIGSKKFKGGPTRAYNEVSYVNAWEPDDPQILDMVETAKPVRCSVPLEILSVVSALDAEYPDVEWSIFCKAEWNDTANQYDLGHEYFLPKQEVSAAHIDYEEDNLDFNVVIHKHPSGCLKFSQTDESYINRNFMLSLLWVNNHFEYGIANIRTRDMGDTRIRVKVEPYLNYNLEGTLPEEHANKIQKKTYQYYGGKYGYQGGYRGYGGGYGTGFVGGYGEYIDEPGVSGQWWTKYHGANFGRHGGSIASKPGTVHHPYHSNLDDDDITDPENNNKYGKVKEQTEAAFELPSVDEIDDTFLPDEEPLIPVNDDGSNKTFAEMSATEWEEYLDSIDHDYPAIPLDIW